jgi:hypothetical protein
MVLLEIREVLVVVPEEMVVVVDQETVHQFPPLKEIPDTLQQVLAPALAAVVRENLDNQEGEVMVLQFPGFRHLMELLGQLQVDGLVVVEEEQVLQDLQYFLAGPGVVDME